MWWNIVCVRGGIVASGFKNEKEANAAILQLEKSHHYSNYILKALSRDDCKVRRFSIKEQRALGKMSAAVMEAA